MVGICELSPIFFQNIKKVWWAEYKKNHGGEKSGGKMRLLIVTEIRLISSLLQAESMCFSYIYII